MIFTLVLLTTFTTLRASKDILVRREQNYDTIVWDGECSRINANTVIFGGEKTCVCKKRFNVNGVKTELNGFFYQNTDGVPACLYDYRETGANFFIHPRYSTSIYVIDDTSHDAKFITQGAHRLYPLRYSPSIRIAIKEIRMYMFNNDIPLSKFPNDIFQLKSQNVTEGDTSRERYMIQVNVTAIKNVKGNLVQIIFEEQYKKDNTKRDIGFTVVKFVGEVTYNLDLSETPQKGTYNIATIALTITAGVFGIIVVILVVKLRYNNSKENKFRVHDFKHLKEKITTSGMRGTPDNRTTRPGKHIINNYKHFHDDDNTAISYITANESSNPNNIRKVEPIYETSDSLGFNKYSEKNDPIMKYGYYNGSYWYDEIQE